MYSIYLSLKSSCVPLSISLFLLLVIEQPLLVIEQPLFQFVGVVSRYCGVACMNFYLRRQTSTWFSLNTKEAMNPF